MMQSESEPDLATTPFVRDDRRMHQSAWLMLHVECDVLDATRLKMELHDHLPTNSQLDHVLTLVDAIDSLAYREYDVVLVGGLEPNPMRLAQLKQLTSDRSHPPVVMISNDDSPHAALEAGRCGVHAFLLKPHVTPAALMVALREAIDYEPSTTPHGQTERRQETRYLVARPAVVFPIRSDGSPGPEFVATTLDLSESGISLLAQRDSDTVPDLCLVGVECRDGIYRYATVEWRHRRLALPAIRFGGRFLRRWDDPFHASRLTPRFDASSLRYRLAMDAAAVKAWAAHGILRSEAIDRTLVCPSCESLPTFRHGCPLCGSHQVDALQLIHHFACAHVASAKSFEKGSLSCPKCRLEGLIVGADFEYLDGPRNCSECDWSGSESTLIAECMKCGHRCAASATLEKEIRAYYVERLDPLALLEDAP